MVFNLAAAEARVTVTADTDFGGLLVLRRQRLPSTIQWLRRTRADLFNWQLLLATCPRMMDDLALGGM